MLRERLLDKDIIRSAELLHQCAIGQLQHFVVYPEDRNTPIRN